MPADGADAQAAGGLTMRSLLFVPADSERKIPKALAAGADAVILDLEDSVTLEAKPRARVMTGELLAGPRPCALFVRVNAIGSGLTLADLAAVLDGRPDGLVLPKSEAAHSVNELASLVTTVAPGLPMPPVIAIATETPTALFGIGTYAAAHPCLAGLTWGMEDLAAALGARSNRDAEGHPTAPYQLARTLCLAGARAAGVEPIDAVFPNFRDSAALQLLCQEAARDGFTGKMCIHPDQVGPINAAFTPTSAELARARRIVEAFAAAGNPGVLAMEGEMLDAPHLKAAQALLRRAHN
jgi:citrate lyase subunit beta/citryl-CoA lyase